MYDSNRTSPLTHKLLRGTILTVLAAIALFAASAASANCANPQRRNGSPMALPFHGQRVGDDSTNSSIVGLWHVTYTLSDDSFFYDAIDQWRSDGTEFEMANLPPATGNVCMGEWKKEGGTIHLNHAGWSFDPSGNSLGMFTITEENVVKGDTYTGTFDFKQLDMNGNVTAEFTGTLSATRLFVN